MSFDQKNITPRNDYWRYTSDEGRETMSSRGLVKNAEDKASVSTGD